MFRYVNADSARSSASLRSFTFRIGISGAALLCGLLAGCGSGYKAVVDPNVVTSVSPAQGPALGGNAVTVNGSGFQSDSYVLFANSAKAQTSFVNGTQLSVIAPAASTAASVAVAVVNDRLGTKEALNNAYTYVRTGAAPATITALTPANVVAGQTTNITIQGTNLGRALQARVNSQLVPTQQQDNQNIIARVPALPAGAYPVDIEVADGTIVTDNLQVQVAEAASTSAAGETITSVQPGSIPASGPASIIVNGTGIPRDSLVFVGTERAISTTSYVSTTAIADIAALSAGSYSVWLQNSDGTTTQYPGSLNVTGTPSTKESIAAVSPTSFPAGGVTNIDIVGNGFAQGAQVHVNGSAVAFTQVISSTHILALMPRLSPGTYPMSIADPDGSTTTYSGSLTAMLPLVVATLNLPQAVATTYYSTALAATGGLPPYTWSVTAGLPSGIQVSTAGVISGTPTASGTYPIAVQVTDADNETAAATLSLAVTAAPFVPTPPTPTPPTPTPPTPTPPTPAPPTAAGTPLTACQALSSANTTYVLQNNVQSPGTCFGIVADNVTLNLNGHTVTYATTDSSRANYGVLSADCWDSELAGIPAALCGGSHKNPVIMNGTLTQGPAAAPQSHAVRFGQGNNRQSETVHDVTINISAQDTEGIYSTFPPGNSQYYKLVINDSVTNVSNRDQFYGYPIRLDYGGNIAGTNLVDVVHDVICNGSPQGCINSEGALLAYNNSGKLGPQQYVGGYGIFLGGNNEEAYGNSFTGATRGFEIEGSNVKLHDNVLDIEDSGSVHDPGHNPDGCEIDGTYGIRVKGYPPTIAPTSVTIANNTVRVTAGPCQAQGLRFTSIASNEQIAVTSNTFTLVQAGSSTMNAGVSLDAADGTGVTFSGNQFTNDPSLFIFYGGYDGATNLNLSGVFTGSNVIYARCGGGACTGLNFTGLPGTPSMQCEGDHQAVGVVANGKSLSCPN